VVAVDNAPQRRLSKECPDRAINAGRVDFNRLCAAESIVLEITVETFSRFGEECLTESAAKGSIDERQGIIFVITAHAPPLVEADVNDELHHRGSVTERTAAEADTLPAGRLCDSCGDKATNGGEKR